jgi:hypothetical protein
MFVIFFEMSMMYFMLMMSVTVTSIKYILSLKIVLLVDSNK